MDQIKTTAKEMTKKTTKKCCKICSIWIDDKSMEQHLKGKKHNSILNQIRMKKRIEMKVASEGIYITGVLPEISNETLINHFQKYGKVVAFQRYHNKGNGLLQFRNKEGAQLALKACHNVQGLLLGTQPRNPAKTNNDFQVPTGKSKQIGALKTTFEKTLQSNPAISVDEQLRLLTTILEMTDDDRQQRSAIISSLEEWLSLEFPGCRLHLFGSSVSGLAFHGDSDVDIFFESPQTMALASNVSSHTLTLNNELGSNQLQTNGKNTPCILRRVSNVLRTHPEITGMFVVSNARIPVAKFKHVPSDINCDLTCNNIIGVRNSKLLYSLQSLDLRIRPFLYALKFWAKSNRLVGSPESTLSSYGLSLLAVFYLQRIEPPVLPSIETLQNRIPVGERVYCNGWNVSFSVPFRDEVGKPADDKTSIFSLLVGFFQFYSQLVANGIVICPRMGKILPKAEFLRTFESVLNSSFKESSLCLQDPFELNFNVTYNFRHFELFQSFCKSAETVCLRILADVGKDSNTTLLNLFKNSSKSLLLSKPLEQVIESCVNLTFEPMNAVTSVVDNNKICQSVGQFIGALFNSAYDVNISKHIAMDKKRQKTVTAYVGEITSEDLVIMWGTNYILTFPSNVFHSKREKMSCVNSGYDTKFSVDTLIQEEKAITTSFISQSKLATSNCSRGDGNLNSPLMSNPFAVVHFFMNSNVTVPSISLQFKKTKETPISNFNELVKGVVRCLSRTVDQFLVISKFPYKIFVKKD